jgi:hypothetical protein
VTGKVNQDDGSDPVYKSQVTFYPEQNGNETPQDLAHFMEGTRVRFGVSNGLWPTVGLTNVDEPD